MKKAKPSKGSARTKKFDAGGLAALAGLGALAYMMRKKKGEEDSSKSDELESVGGAGRRARTVEEQIGRKAESAAEPASTPSKFGGERNLGAAIVETGTRPGPDTTAPKAEAKTEPISKPKPKVVSQTFPLSKPAKTTKAGGEGFGKTTSLAEDSSQAKAMREQRKQRLGTEYAKQYSAYQSAPEGAGKEALKKSMERAKRDYEASPMKKGGAVKKYASGGSVSSASKRADGIATKGKTRGRIC